jgi:hypothetical protein
MHAGRGQEAYPAKDEAWRGDGLDQAQQDVWGIHGSEEACHKEDGGEYVKVVRREKSPM